jgi:uncharacterized membrane protein YkoI
MAFRHRFAFAGLALPLTMAASASAEEAARVLVQATTQSTQPSAAQPAAQPACLSGEQMREAVVAGHAVPASAATRAARDASTGEIVRVRLCHEQERLVYRVTLLQRDGRVGHVTIDGSSGRVADVR